MVICLERGTDLHMAQLLPLPLTVSCFSKTQIDFTFLVPAYPGSPGQRAIKRVCVCGCIACLQVSGGGGAGGADFSGRLVIVVHPGDRCQSIFFPGPTVV